MAQKIKAIRGMNDITPDKMPYWHKLETTCRELMQSYAYQEIRFPIVESTDLFKRSIGDVTDIVEKEMYTFEDRNGDSLSLRPEGTAGCVRAGIENNLLYNQIRRLWYTGPMYRHERPQKGRYRQFYQIGVEAYGMNGPEIDVEIICLTADLLHRLDLKNQVELQINTLGHPDARKAYRDILVEFLQKHKDKLDEDSQRRLSTNPLRILDSKNPDVQAIVKDAPKLMDHLDDDSKNHFAKLKTLLDTNNIKYVINPNLVRGLDYYGYTVFEWVTSELGAQGTVIAGGRYNGLVEQLGGKATPAVGFAAGLERLILMMENNVELKPDIDVYCVIAGDDNVAYAMQQIRALREACPHLKIETDLTGGKFKNQFKRADMSGAKYALIIGDDEQKNKTISIKDMSGKTEQQTLNLDDTIRLCERAPAN